MSTNRILSEAEMSAVHGGFVGIPLTTNYQTMFAKFVQDIAKNLSNNKLNYLLDQDFSFRNHVKP